MVGFLITSRVVLAVLFGFPIAFPWRSFETDRLREEATIVGADFLCDQCV